MARTLLINVRHDGRGGRAQLSNILLDGLQGILGDKLEILSLPRGGRSTGLIERLAGRIDGISHEIESSLLSRISRGDIDCVFMDGSNLGRLVWLIKRTKPTVNIITFFHNVEARFFFDSFRATPSLHAAGVLFANARAERWATRYSDYRVTLNMRDARLLGSLYGRPGTDIIPMALYDRYDPTADKLQRPYGEAYALFVGGDFYANVEGMAWYAQKVAPHAPMPTLVIGWGMEAHRARLERWGGVRVIGPVKDLAPWYAHAQVVVAPILSGSGMKTKTAEALMHGKPIIGTPEAFVGYKKSPNNRLRVCQNETDFLDALNSAVFFKSQFDDKMRKMYMERHSEAAMRGYIEKILLKAQIEKN